MADLPQNKGLTISIEQVNPINVSSDDQNLQPAPGGWKILKQAMIKDLKKIDIFNTVLISVARAFADMNVKDISDIEREYLVNELTNNIIKYYPSIRLSEIPDAVALGIRGRFGEFYGLSVVSFEMFIGRYLQSEKRTAMVKALPADDDCPVMVPDLQTQFETAKYNTLQALQRKQNKMDIEIIASSVYNFLDRLKLISFTKAEKRDMMADAVRELINDLKFKLTIARESERKQIKKDIEDYKLSITQHKGINNRLFNLVVLRSKKLALDAFLNNVIMEDIDLEGLVESKRNVF